MSASTQGTQQDATGRRIKVGIIGCGEIAQVSHIAALNNLSDLYQITYLCEVSRQTLAHCARKVNGPAPKTTTNAQELCASSEVDAVLVCSTTALHAAQAELALRHDKHVFVEKPLALCYRDIDALAAAEARSKGKLFVGYMRRYAAGFLDAVSEVGDSKIQYARVRDIIGPNAHFVGQSGTFPKRIDDIDKADSDQLAALEKEINDTALLEEFGVPSTDHTQRMLGLLGGLGSHDLSAMREAIGMPRSVASASLLWPIWTATFEYDGFVVVYESGINDVPTFDAHIELYTNSKIVRVNVDTPFIKGLPTTMTVREKATGPRGEPCYQERHVRTTYEDPYTLEFKEWHACMVHNKPAKTSIADARQDVDIWKMLMQSAFSTTKGT